MVAVGRWLLSPKFKRCDERVIDGACEKTQTDDCCAVIPCKLCLTLEVYPDTYKSSAVWADGAYTGQYTGTIDGHEFVAYWEKDSGTCYFVVEWDGYEVARYEKCGYEGMNCRTVGDTITVDTGYDETGELTFSMSEKIELPHYQEPIVRCNTLDVAFVLDDTGSMADTLTELKDNIAEIVAQIEAVSESYQLALITFKDTVTTDLSFSENNGAAFTAALAGVSAASGGNIPEASDVALETAVNLAGWRSGGVGRKKIIILVTDAPPGGLDDTDDEADLDNLVLQATTAGDNGIILAAVQSGTFTQTGTALRAAVTANGERARYIPSVTDMVSRIRGMIDTECPDHTPCTEPYCGELQCVEKYICLTVRDPDGAVVVSTVIENNTDYDYCDIPEWDIDVADGSFAVAGTIALGRDDYDGSCFLSVPGADGYDETATITGTDPLTASWEVDYYTFEIVGTDCGDCVPPEYLEPCCPDSNVPDSLTITVTLAGTGDVNCDGEYIITTGLSRTLTCPVCCDANDAPLTELPQTNESPLEYVYHGGGAVTINGGELRICLILCASEGPGTTKPTAASDDPDDQWVGAQIVLNDSLEKFSAWTLCSPIGFSGTVSDAVILNYCPDNDGGTMTITVSE